MITTITSIISDTNDYFSKNFEKNRILSKSIDGTDVIRKVMRGRIIVVEATGA